MKKIIISTKQPAVHDQAGPSNRATGPKLFQHHWTQREKSDLNSDQLNNIF